jgi:hypothetical protein
MQHYGIIGLVVAVLVVILVLWLLGGLSVRQGQARG